MYTYDKTFDMYVGCKGSRQLGDEAACSLPSVSLYSYAIQYVWIMVNGTGIL